MSGTPKTLEEAIQQAIMLGPVSEVRERSHAVIKDFLAQKFSLAMINMDQWRDGSSTRLTPEEILSDLYESCVSRGKACPTQPSQR